MPKARKNPIYSRWVDPFFGMTREDLLEIGKGDAQRGYDEVLDAFITSWNESAKRNKYIPPTSRERGMEWMPDIKKISAEHRRILREEKANGRT